MKMKQFGLSETKLFHFHGIFKETKSATMFFFFESFVKVELSYTFTIDIFTIAENCTEK